MNTYIKIKTQFESTHQWSTAPEEVAFLRNLHRHLFICIVKIAVSHNNRDIEFFLFKKEVDRLIEVMLWKFTTNKSCEMMAEYLVSALDSKYHREIEVEVSEDGENSAVVNNKEIK